MKIANLIPVYLAQKKVIELQGLGRFTFSGEEIEISQEDFVFPDGSVQFEADKSCGLSEDLILFMVEKSGKVRSLVISDLDSFIQLGLQFLNLGKPFEIPGVGQIKRDGKGKIEFTHGAVLPTKMELREPLKTEQALEKGNISFRTEKKKEKTFRHKNRIIAILILAMLAITYLLIENNRRSNESKPGEKLMPQPEIIHNATKDSTSQSQSITVDSDSLAIDSSMNLVPRGFRVVVKEYPSDSRAQGFKRLLERNHEIIVFTKDSVLYKVAIPFDEPLTDTSRIRDSIRAILGIPVYIELP